MNLLIINYEMDPHSQVLSWQIRVAYALAENFNQIIVLTHKQQNIDQRVPNVKIISFPFLANAPFRWLGGEYILNIWIWFLHRKYHFDRCFMHMNYKWAYRFFLFFKLSKIPVSIWYAHGTVSWQLRLAHYFANKIITSTEEGFKISSKKVVYIGQGIDTDLFKLKKFRHSINILYVGRISKVKRIDALIAVLAVLANQIRMPKFTLTIIGGPLNEDDRKYYDEIYEQIVQNKLTEQIFLEGPVKHQQVADYYNDCFLHLSFSQTGSMDKTLMESLATGCPILTSNPALFNLIDNKYKITNMDYQAVANQIVFIYNEQANINRSKLRDIVISSHNFNNYIFQLTNQIT